MLKTRVKIGWWLAMNEMLSIEANNRWCKEEEKGKLTAAGWCGVNIVLQKQPCCIYNWLISLILRLIFI